MKTTVEKDIYRAVWPRGRKTGKIVSPAGRLSTLDGKTIGELWNYSFHGREVFAALEAELASRHPGIRFVSYDVFGNIHDSHEDQVLKDLPAKLRETGCDAVITGMGC